MARPFRWFGIHRQTRSGERHPSLPFDEPPKIASKADPPAVIRVGVKVSVSELDMMRRFYEEIIGLQATRIGADFVTLNDVLALTASERLENQGPSRVAVHVNITGIDELWARVKKAGVKVVEPLNGENGRRRFRCLDPEGNVLEVREAQ